METFRENEKRQLFSEGSTSGRS